MKITLVADVNNLWKRWSSRIAGVQLTAALAYWGLIPAEWKAAVPNWAIALAVAFFGAAFLSAQSIKQSTITTAPSTTPPNGGV